MKPDYTVVSLRMRRDLHARLVDAAYRNRNSLNSEIVHQLEAASLEFDIETAMVRALENYFGRIRLAEPTGWEWPREAVHKAHKANAGSFD
jgi:seryl-tRNA synthetase